ncbi:ABC transporter ATP-binding protein [Thermomicrobiaceae bacterium CFH 74404]|uniref:ABC transporter ATP-binding protein n=1 Tax=Thermalbibacter longus TaxID=2951981 RepID=A0AA42BAU2_9BACT|nr:ABC transporter ATP-binding protein [Thermalbibacter longus]MCM8750226.1 ABC transporter ATP-binding protein [Thermalbibacter longus]
MISENDAAARRASDPVTQEPILEAEHLKKSYGGRPALRDLSFTLAPGRILGFLGPNGAGKTTSIRILTTILEPDEGHFAIAGISSRYPERIRARIGVLPESQGYPKEMTGIDYLVYFGQHYGWTSSEARQIGWALLEVVGLQHRARSLIGSYSRGMRQRLGIARALVNDPAVVFLDEPTLGLDPRGQQELLALIRRIARERGAAVILCSHLLSEIESVCDDVVILSVGQVVARGSVTEVIGQARGNGVRIQVPLSAVAEAEQVLEALPDVIRVVPKGQGSGWIQVELLDGAPEDNTANNAVLEALIQAKIPILTFEAEGSRLQEVFLQLTEEAIR